jgi:hypothetical protein
MSTASGQHKDAEISACRDDWDVIAAKDASKPRQDRLVDAAVEDSFPASDPPAYMGGTATGAPRDTNQLGPCPNDEAADDKAISPRTSSTAPSRPAPPTSSD